MKKIIITCLITLFITIGLVHLYDNWYIDYNLRKYSVYYAHNMEHKEGAHPEMAMALENIKVIYTPASKGIRYDYDGLAKVYNDINNRNNPSICATYVYGVEYLYSKSKDRSYIFNSDFSLKAIYDSNTAKMEYEKSDIDEEKLYKEVYKNFGFLVEANVNRKPLINMQKEFNKKYYKRFN
ncbi:hypothetical protein [Mogibacterium pumilum]|uniref:DUF4825 domain-containing protein n=1 Tax=Mogibacterium pumilum TaxID=86332 RepID=A0A223AQ67_9FIRM|nr:hypothetical protein [Mogibacterium pumilum]ASS37104.1 hypothetical protein AXF17_00510 [Mogibacterium pumilum]